MFPGNPHDHSPCSSTPAGPSTRVWDQGSTYSTRPPHQSTTRAPHVANFGAQSHGFWSRCLRLEVEVTRHRARLASGCWSQLCRTGFDPQGFYERFLNWNSSSFPELHGASFALALFYHRNLPRFAFTGHCSFAPRPTPPSAGPTGSGRAGPSPAGDCQTLTTELEKTERGPISTIGTSILKYVTKPGDRFGRIKLFLPARRRTTVGRPLVAGGAQSQWLQACLPNGHEPYCPPLHVIDPLGPDAYREAKGSAGLAFSFFVPECDKSIRTTSGQSASHFCEGTPSTARSGPIRDRARGQTWIVGMRRLFNSSPAKRTHVTHPESSRPGHFCPTPRPSFRTGT